MTTAILFGIHKLWASVAMLLIWLGPAAIAVLGSVALYDHFQYRKASLIVWQICWVVSAVSFMVPYYVAIHPDPESRPGAFIGPAQWSINTLRQSYGEFKAESTAIQPVRVNGEAAIRRYILVRYNPPKHFYVTLKDVETNELYENTYVSKHCNTASALKLGEPYNLRVQYYTYSNAPNKRYFEFTNLYSEFCGG